MHSTLDKLHGYARRRCIRRHLMMRGTLRKRQNKQAFPSARNTSPLISPQRIGICPRCRKNNPWAGDLFVISFDVLLGRLYTYKIKKFEMLDLDMGAAPRLIGARPYGFESRFFTGFPLASVLAASAASAIGLFAVAKQIVAPLNFEG